MDVFAHADGGAEMETLKMKNLADKITQSWSEGGTMSSEVKTLLHGYNYPLNIRERDIDDGWRELGELAVGCVIADEAPRDLIALKIKVGAFMAAFRDLGFSSDEIIDWAVELDPDTFRRVAIRHLGLLDPEVERRKQATAAKAARRAAKRQAAAKEARS